MWEATDSCEAMVRMTQPRAQRRLKVQPLSWRNCGPPDAPIILHNLTLTPAPVPLPGDIHYGLAMEFKEAITGKLALTLIVKKKIGSEYIKIPCTGEIGSCSWGNACAFDPLPSVCPNNFPCHCPFPKGNFSIPYQAAHLDPGSSIPPWLVEGDYQVQGSLQAGTRVLACFFIQLSIA